MKMKDVESLSKLELHAHLNGSLSIKTLQELAEINGDSKTSESGWPQWKEALSDLSSCFELFRIAHNLTQTTKAVYVATLRTIQEFAEDNVIYLELRSTLRNLKDGGKKDYLQAMIDGVLAAKESIPSITVTILVSINRSESIDDAKENANVAVEFRKKYPDIVVGLDLSGDPTKGKFEDFVPILSGVRPELKVTVHFGEVRNDEEVAAILKFGADRLGHGTFLSEENLDVLRRTKTPVELCLTSNVKCGTVASCGDHHFRKLKDLGHPVVLCTDDKGVFSTSLTTEYTLACLHFSATVEDCWQMNFDAVDYSFATDAVKNNLKDTLLRWKNQDIT